MIYLPVKTAPAFEMKLTAAQINGGKASFLPDV
jgi:hypothetical protein